MGSFDIIQFNGASVSFATGKPYPPKPRWNGSGDPMPDVHNSVGYDVRAPEFPAARREAAYRSANATINDNTYQWPMFIHDVQIDIALAGITAQSRTTRDFYPHNFIQPAFQIQGQALDQRDYGDLTGFLHRAQKRAVEDGQLMQLWIKGMGIAGTRRFPGQRGVRKGNAFHGNQLIRGPHQTLLCQGYVASMPREHKVGDVSPQYSFGFIVADMMQGPYKEDLVQVMQQKTWIDILKSTKTFKVDAALLKENKKNLDWIAANSDNILNTGGGTINGGSGGAGVSAFGAGPKWLVPAAAEDDPPGTTASCGPLPGDRRGYSVASVSGTAHDPGTAGQALTPGHVWPCGVDMIIGNPANGKSVRAHHVDNGSGSDSILPVIGIYPQTRADLGLDNNGSYHVFIQRADGQPIHPTRGRPA